MSPPKPDAGADVMKRIRRLARERGEDVQLLLLRHVNERLLFRLASSAHAPQFVLKGAAMFTVWNGSPHRATRDLDLLGMGDPSESRIRQVFPDLLVLTVPDDDGVRFDLDSLSVEAIRDSQEYGGVRVEARARVASARVRIQVDVGFGDAITPDADIVEFPSLLQFPAPRLRAYPRESVIAEKLEAMVQLGMVNSRMKDFYDIAQLARDFPFDGPLLVRAIRATFDRRSTPLPASVPVALTPAFSEDSTKQSQWAGFLRKTGIRDAATLPEVIAEVRRFVEQPLLAAARGQTGPGVWKAAEGWEEPRTSA